MTAMTQATGLCAGAIAVSAADASAASSVTSATDVPVWSVVVLLVGLAVSIGWADRKLTRLNTSHPPV